MVHQRTFRVTVAAIHALRATLRQEALHLLVTMPDCRLRPTVPGLQRNLHCGQLVMDRTGSRCPTAVREHALHAVREPPTCLDKTLRVPKSTYEFLQKKRPEIRGDQLHSSHGCHRASRPVAAGAGPAFGIGKPQTRAQCPWRCSALRNAV